MSLSINHRLIRSYVVYTVRLLNETANGSKKLCKEIQIEMTIVEDQRSDHRRDRGNGRDIVEVA